MNNTGMTNLGTLRIKDASIDSLPVDTRIAKTRLVIIQFLFVLFGASDIGYILDQVDSALQLDK